MLGADHETDICEQFGVWVEKSMYGRSYMGIQRATFLVGADGRILHIWPKVKVPVMQRMCKPYPIWRLELAFAYG